MIDRAKDLDQTLPFSFRSWYWFGRIIDGTSNGDKAILGWLWVVQFG